MENFYTAKSKYLLALHSCSESFGVAVKDSENQNNIIKSQVFHLGRSLSNRFFSCLEIILPRKFWKQIVRISVATGPGSFTSTRLSISMARTISQQINCSLDGMSSFHLMAPRLHKELNLSKVLEPFWIKDILPRRGVVAGKYQLIKIHKNPKYFEFNEIISPQLINKKEYLTPSINALTDIEKDIISLLQFSQFCHNSKVNSNWDKLLPLYPTSPLDNKKTSNF